MTNREYLKQLLDDRSEEGADQLSERLNCPPHYIDYSDGCTGICRRGQECDQCQQEWLDMEADEKMTKHYESKEELEAKKRNLSWTPITEALPPVRIPLIVSIINHFNGEARELRYPVYYIKEPFEGRWVWKFQDGYLLPDYSEVVAWMELPKPYERIDA